MTKLVPVQVNDADYGDDRVLIEAKSYFNHSTGEFEWAVPAWEERGLGERVFATRAQAEAVLRKAAPVLLEYGFEAVFHA